MSKYRVNITIETVNDDGTPMTDKPTPTVVDSVGNLTAEQSVAYQYAAKAVLGAAYIKAADAVIGEDHEVTDSDLVAACV